MTQKFSRGRPLASGTERTTPPLISQGEEVGLPPELFPGSWARTDLGQFYSDGVVWRPVIPLGVEIGIPDFVEVPLGWFTTGAVDASGNRVITNEFDFRYVADDIRFRFQARLGYYPTLDRGVRVVGDFSVGSLRGGTRIDVDNSGAATYRIRARVRAIGTIESRIYVGVETFDAAGESERSGPGSHRYAAAAGPYVPNDAMWYVYEATISGNGNTSSREFRPGTVQARPLLFANHRQDANAILEVDELSFWEVTPGGDVLLNENPYFFDGLQGWDPTSDYETRESGGLWTTADQSVNVTEPPSLVGFATDTSDSGNDAIQTVSANRPTFDVYPPGHPLEGIGYFDFSTIDSNLVMQNSADASGDLFVASEWGILQYNCRLYPGVDVNIGSLGADIWYDAIFVQGALRNPKSEALVRNFIESYGYPENTTAERTDWSRAFKNNNMIREIFWNQVTLDFIGGTDMTECFRGCTLLRDTGDRGSSMRNVVTAERAFQDCSALVIEQGFNFSSCENMDFCFLNCSATDRYGGSTLPALLTAEGAWQNCTGLVDFPTSRFDEAACTNYRDAWTNCALSQESVDNILVSINTARAALSLTGGRIDITGGTSAPPSSPTGEDAVNELRAAGWTVNLNGF